MQLHNLKPAVGSTKSGKRIARGQGSGYGGTSTRGHKGAKSRSGYSKKRNFEGGQMPLQMRLPKRGFNSPNKTNYVIFNLSTLKKISEKYNETDINAEWLYQNGFIKKGDKIKILAVGEISKPMKISAHAFSKNAEEALKEAGSSILLLTKEEKI